MEYQYDPNGNTTSKTAGGITTNFFFDIRDQLGEVRQAGNVLGRYGYDYNARRILKIGDDGRRQYTYDQLSVITEADQVNATVSKYDYGMDQLVRLDNRGEGRSFFHLDGLRSTVSLTDAAGGSRQSIFYDAWGNERDRIGASANKFTFTGHELDEETGLIYAKARFYDSDVGRFLSQDDLLGEAPSPPSLHRYFYANQNPLAFIDPNGREAAGISLAASRGEFFDPGGPEGFARASGTFAGAGQVLLSPVTFLYYASGAKQYQQTGDPAFRDEAERFAQIEAGLTEFIEHPFDTTLEGFVELRRQHDEAVVRGDTYEANRARAAFFTQAALFFVPARALLRTGAGTAPALVTSEGVVMTEAGAVAATGPGNLAAGGTLVLSESVTEREPSGVRSETTDGTTEGKQLEQSSRGGPNRVEESLPSAPLLEPGRTPLREFDIDKLGTFSNRPRVGDALAGHEMLQNAWLKAHGYIEKRGVGSVSRNNPAVGLNQELHTRVGVEQAKLGLHDPAKLKAMDPLQNIDLNAHAMRNAGVPEHVIQSLQKEAVEHAGSLSK